METFIKSIQNTRYVWWSDGEMITGKAPFWAEDKPIPNISLIKHNGCNCAGFINLICRYLNIPIPGVKEKEEWAGGSWFWFKHLSNSNKLELFDSKKEYPEGTLLLRNYKSPFDQGHLAIFLKNNRIAHCYPGKGIQIEESFIPSHKWLSEGYYTHISLPYIWMDKNKSL